MSEIINNSLTLALRAINFAKWAYQQKQKNDARKAVQNLVRKFSKNELTTKALKSAMARALKEIEDL